MGFRISTDLNVLMIRADIVFYCFGTEIAFYFEKS